MSKNSLPVSLMLVLNMGDREGGNTVLVNVSRPAVSAMLRWVSFIK